MKPDIRHDDAFERLNDFVDGELEPGVRTAVEQHVQACSRCTAEVAAIRALVQRARALPEEIEVRRHVWRDIESRIRAAAAAERQQPAAARPPAARRWFDSLHAPAWRWASAAGAAALVVSMTIAAWQRWNSGHLTPEFSTPAAGVENPGLDSPMRLTVSALEQECMGAGKSLVASMDDWPADANDEFTASIMAGLDAVNQAIAETRAALVSDPQDAELLRLLTARYEQKLALLHGAMRLIEEA